jgi:trk system potassium uptake protein
MKIIILGAGQVGLSLAENLINENHDITLIDADEAALQQVAERLDLRTVCGHGSYPEVLREAGADSADMLLAVTDSDEVNMVACQVAYSLFNVGKKIARIRSQHYLIRDELFGSDNLPIDVFISPEQLVTQYVQQLIAHPGASQVFTFADGAVKMVSVRTYYGGSCIGKTVLEIYEALHEIQFNIMAIYRGEKAVAMEQDLKISIGDEVLFVCKDSDAHTIMAAFRRMEEPYQRVMIAGGGSIGSCLAEAIQDDYSVKVVDRNIGRCKLMAEKLSVMVLHGDACDADLLRNENIDSIDVFCAVTNDDEDNIISCLQAKRMGVKQVMSLVNRTAYVDMVRGGPINIAISPQQATVGSILCHLRKGDVLNVYAMRGGDAEVLEVRVHGDKKTSKLVGHTIDHIKLPKGVCIGALVREGRLILPSEGVEVLAGDHMVILVSDKRKLPELGKLLQVSADFF